MEKKSSSEGLSMTLKRRRRSSGGKKKKNVVRGRGNGGPENARCGYRGVRQRAWGRWVAEIGNPSTRSRVWLGSFATAAEAAIAYDAAARQFYGSGALLNLPHQSQQDTQINSATAHPDDRHGDLGKFLEHLMGNVMREPTDRLDNLQQPTSPFSSAHLAVAFDQDAAFWDIIDHRHHFLQTQMADSNDNSGNLENYQFAMEDLSIPMPLPIWDFHDQ